MRRQAREMALQILFSSEFTSHITLNQLMNVFDSQVDQETKDYAETLISGVRDNAEKINQMIQQSSRHWKIDRMPTVDRNILRICVYEMMISPNPLKENIAIDEAIELAKKYGTTDSSSFVNGVLDHVSKTKWP
jgi:N utilization substance protein B